MLVERGIEISSAKTILNWLHKWAMAMWEVANGKISVLLIYKLLVPLIIKSYSSMKLTRNNSFRPYLIKR